MEKGMRRSKNQWREAPIHWMRTRHSVNEGFGKEFYRKGNSMKGLGPFSVPLVKRAFGPCCQGFGSMWIERQAFCLFKRVFEDPEGNRDKKIRMRLLLLTIEVFLLVVRLFYLKLGRCKQKTQTNFRMGGTVKRPNRFFTATGSMFFVKP